MEREYWSVDHIQSVADDSAKKDPVAVPKDKKDLEKNLSKSLFTFDQWKEALMRLAESCYGGWAGWCRLSP